MSTKKEHTGIVICEKVADIAADLEHRLTRLGYTTCGSTNSPEEALNLVEYHQPGLVLMDVELEEEMDGIRAAEIIKDKWQIPVVFLTDHAETERLERAREADPAGYLIKPLRDRAIKVTVETALYLSNLDNERRKTEQALREETAWRRVLIQGSRDGIVVLEQTGKVYEANQKFADMLGYSIEEAMNLHVWDWDDQWSKEHLLGMIESVDETGDHFETLHRRKDGTRVDVEISTNGAVRDGRKLVFCVCRDITSRKRAEEALRESDKRFRNIVKNSDAGYFFIDRSGVIQDVNEAWLRMYKYTSADEIIGQHFSTIQESNDVDKANRFVAEIIAGNPEYSTGEFSRKCKDNTIGYHNFTAKPVTKSGQVIGIEGFIIDSTERKNAENALKQSEERFRDMVEGSIQGVLIHRNDKALFVNQAYSDIFGYSIDEILQMETIYQMIHPDEHIYLETYREARLKGDDVPSSYEFKGIRKDGSEIIVENMERVVNWAGGDAVQMIVVNITARKMAEEALRKSENTVSKKLHAILEPEGDIGTLELADVIDSDAIQSLMDDLFQLNNISAALLDLNGKVLVATGWQDICTKFHRTHPVASQYCLESDTELSKGLKLGEFKLYRCKNNLWDIATPIIVGGKHLGNFYLGQFFFDDEQRDKDLFRRQARQYGFDEEEYLRALDRVPCWDRETVYRMVVFYAKLANLLSSQGLSNLKLAKTLSEKERLQDQLLQARKMEAVGTLAGGIAHDFNNLLQVINGYTQIMLLDKTENDSDFSPLTAIHIAVGRAATLIRQLLLFSRKLETEKKPVDLNREIEQVRTILERTIPKMIDIEFHSGSRLWSINADPVQIEQILLNLGINAADALPDGGKFIIKTNNVRINEKYTNTHLDVPPGDYVLLTVSDTGLGMDEKTVEHIFEPFFTTKDIGKGTGLGLASVHGIVKSHGGYIICDSEVGKGTTFRVYLPAIEHQYQDVEESLRAKSLRCGTETILLVDDEEAIRNLVTKLLQKYDYTVMSAANGEEALEIYGKKSNRIDLVILDIGMPGMGGHRCVQQLKQINPEAKILIASGYSLNDQIKKTLHSSAAGYVGKPYQIADLLNTVRTVLENNK